MAINKNLILASGVATAVGIGSCQKYEDGPAFSLLSKKQRLTGEWEVTDWVAVDGQDLTALGFDLEMEFDSDGDFEFTVKAPSNYGFYNYSESGEWEFSSDKEEIEIEFNEEGSWDIEITRLTNKEFQGKISTAGFSGHAEFEAEKD